MTSRRRNPGARPSRARPPAPQPPEPVAEEPVAEVPAPPVEEPVAERSTPSVEQILVDYSPPSLPALVPAKDYYTPDTVLITPLANTGYCPNGHMVWSGGPPSEGEFPLTCRYCEVLVPRP